MLVGIIIGNGNRRQFRDNHRAYDFSIVPKYIDFFNNKEDYTQNYFVLVYLGNYQFVREKIEKALFYFENALNAAKTDAEKQEVQAKIKQCYSLMGTKN